jgi:sigma-B regulation protein RsbU (phosphoserine phosphatase)
MPAALLMASLQAHTQAITELGGELGGDPSNVVAKLNRAITKFTPDNRFVTFFLAVFNPLSSTLTYCNAGHNPPLLIRSDGSVERLEEGGMVLGLFAGAAFVDKTIRFDPGDLLILYSDGVVEACSVNGDEEFGEERLLKIASDSGSLDVPRVTERVIEALRAWSGDGSFADDVTVVLARRTAAG